MLSLSPCLPMLSWCPNMGHGGICVSGLDGVEKLGGREDRLRTRSGWLSFLARTVLGYTSPLARHDTGPLPGLLPQKSPLLVDGKVAQAAQVIWKLGPWSASLLTVLQF